MSSLYRTLKFKRKSPTRPSGAFSAVCSCSTTASKMNLTPLSVIPLWLRLTLFSALFPNINHWLLCSNIGSIVVAWSTFYKNWIRNEVCVLLWLRRTCLIHLIFFIFSFLSFGRRWCSRLFSPLLIFSACRDFLGFRIIWGFVSFWRNRFHSLLCWSRCWYFFLVFIAISKRGKNSTVSFW